MEPIKLNVWGEGSTKEEPDQSEGGFDSTIIGVPEAFFVQHEGKKTLNVRVAGAMLRKFAEQQAKNLGRELHHAEFVVTNDPKEIKTRGLEHDCVTCRHGVDQALARLREEPQEPLIVGTLYWKPSKKKAKKRGS